jgi:formimidoylglutamate deiminase
MIVRMTSTAIFAQTARLPGRWAHDVRLRIDGGAIAAIDEGARAQPGDAQVALLLPGMVNLHSHAFQRALAGLTEVASSGDDDFWSWREWMYRFMQRLTPDDVEAIAAQLYVESLRHGYTSIVEFHYLHNDADGRAYADRAEMAHRIVAARETSGIALTLLPVLYTYGGFGRQPLSNAQRRFASRVDDVLQIVAALSAAGDGDLVLGVAPHSLRAAEATEIRALVNAAAGPVHLHAAEQTREVDECVAATGRRPVRLLLDTVGLDARWCVVHATHMTDDETRDLAASAAVAGLCPSTEADLGDGVFPFVAFGAARGRFGIGGDSHVCRSPIEELRLLEYTQRLTQRRRNLALHAPGHAIADDLWDAAAAGGAQAAGRACGRIAQGLRADLIGVRLSDAAAGAYRPENWLSQAVFAGAGWDVTDAWVGGAHVIRDGRHARQDEIAARYAATVRKLLI